MQQEASIFIHDYDHKHCHFICTSSHLLRLKLSVGNILFEISGMLRFYALSADADDDDSDTDEEGKEIETGPASSELQAHAPSSEPETKA